MKRKSKKKSKRKRKKEGKRTKKEKNKMQKMKKQRKHHSKESDWEAASWYGHPMPDGTPMPPPITSKQKRGKSKEIKELPPVIWHGAIVPRGTTVSYYKVQARR